MPLAKKKRLSLRDRGGAKQPGSGSSLSENANIASVERRDLSSYFAAKGTQKVVQSDQEALPQTESFKGDEHLIIPDLPNPWPGPSPGARVRIFEGAGEIQNSSHVNVDCQSESWQIFDEEFSDVERLEQIISKYDKPGTVSSPEGIKPENCFEASTAGRRLEASDKLQDTSCKGANFLDIGNHMPNLDDAEERVEDLDQVFSGDEKNHLLLGQLSFKLNTSLEAFRADLFYDKETYYGAGDEIPSGTEQSLDSQVGFPAGKESLSAELSFRDSFYKGGTNWSTLHEVDEYGLPCSGGPTSSPRMSPRTRDSGATQAGSESQCNLDIVNSSLGSHISSSGTSWYKKDEKKMNISRCFSKLKQVDLSSYLGFKRKPSQEESHPVKKPGQQDIGKYFGFSSLAKQPTGALEFKSNFRQVDTSPTSMNAKGTLKKRSKDATPGSCPFYKKMPGTPFTVDAFKFGAIEGCRAYFLSHFHSDHYGGLTRSWSHGPIYCTPVTSRLVSMCLGVDAQWLRPVKLGVTLVVEGVEVQFLEANHCPGAAIILFQLPGGQRILHTGDFRACKGMQTYPELLSSRIFSLYLDTTYCNPRYNFPLQEDIISFVVKVTKAALSQNPRTLVVVGAYSIGKERVYLGIAKALDLKIFADKRRSRILMSLEWPELSERLCADASESCLHVLPIWHLRTDKLRAYMQSLHPQHTAVLGFRPTGWTYSEKVGPNLDLLKPQRSGPVTVYGVPYSEHSSFSELREFVQFLRPQKIIATVNIGTAAQRDCMQSHFNQWLRG